tara:strand:+ start:409 stop:582 length:174 start_codon:yes stop_codon:yes gene_type:complete
VSTQTPNFRTRLVRAIDKNIERKSPEEIEKEKLLMEVVKEMEHLQDLDEATRPKESS